MALTEITNISNYQFSKNPVVAQIETDAYLLTAGGYASISIDASTASGANTSGGTILFSWATDSVLFTVAASRTDDSGYQVEPKAAYTAAQYAAVLKTDFEKNYIFSENYSIALDGSTLIITAKNKGTAYALYDNFTSANFGYVINATHSDGSDITYAENYKMIADLWMENNRLSGVMSKVATQALDPLNNKCTFDFQTEINANLQYDLPAYAATTPFNCYNAAKLFYVRYYEQFGDPVQKQQVNRTDAGYILKAGITKQKAIGESNLVASTFLTTPGTFLTKQPRTKKITELQQEYLCLIDSLTAEWEGYSPVVKATITTIYGKVITVTASASIVGQYKQLNCFPVGFTALGLSAHADFVDVKKYTVQIIDSFWGVLSEVFTFVPDTDSYVDEHHILFTNSYSGFDTVRLSGVLEEAFEIEKETINKTRLFDTAVTTGEFAEIAHQKSDRFKVNTGFITKAQSDWLEDLFLSEQKFVVRDGMFIPIVISTTSIKKGDSRSTIYFYEFEYTLAFKNSAV